MRLHHRRMGFRSSVIFLGRRQLERVLVVYPTLAEFSAEGRDNG
jgi:hypothetical protein